MPRQSEAPVMRMRLVVRRSVGSMRVAGPSRVRAMVQALGIGLPLIGAIGLLLSLWIYAIPRFEDLALLRGDVARAEIVRPRRGALFALVTLAGGEVLHVLRVRAVKGAADGIRTLRPGDSVTAWIEPHEIERPRHHVVWQMYRGDEPIVELTDVVGPLEWERGRFRTFCGIVTIGVVCFFAGFGFARFGFARRRT